MIPIRDHNPTRTPPFVNSLLVVANIAVFIYMLTLGRRQLSDFILQYSLIPSRFEIIDLITSQFLHGGLLHIFSNMLFLRIFGSNLEDSLGHIRYLFFYIICGMIAGLTQYFISTGSSVPILGASGAIAGTMGGYLLLFPDSRIDVILPLFFFFPVITLPAFTILIYWVAAQFLQGVGALQQETSGGVAFFAHVGGFIAGLILAKIIPKARRY